MYYLCVCTRVRACMRVCILFFILTANGFLPGGSGTTVGHNTTHITQNNTPRSNKTQHTKLHTQ
jgi:hypothetical protein